MDRQIKTIRGYDFYEVTSAMQKAIRRSDLKLAGYFALELFESGFWLYLWKRLLTISAEDCYGILTQEIYALFQGFLWVNEGKSIDTGAEFWNRRKAKDKLNVLKDSQHKAVLMAFADFMLARKS